MEWMFMCGAGFALASSCRWPTLLLFVVISIGWTLLVPGSFILHLIAAATCMQAGYFTGAIYFGSRRASRAPEPSSALGREAPV
jgi:hypothetical protein